MSDKTHIVTFTIDIVDDGEGEVVYSVSREEKPKWRKGTTTHFLAKGSVETFAEALEECARAVHLHADTLDKVEGIG